MCCAFNSMLCVANACLEPSWFVLSKKIAFCCEKSCLVEAKHSFNDLKVNHIFC